MDGFALADWEEIAFDDDSIIPDDDVLVLV
jgi:hypothetical protein